MVKNFERDGGHMFWPSNAILRMTCAALLGSLATQAIACEADPLCNIILENSVSTFENATLSSIPQVVDQRKFISVDPVRIPNFFQSDSEFTDLDSLDDLFSKTPEISRGSANSLAEHVGSFIEKVEVEEQEAEEEPESVKEARAFLFVEGDKPSDAYQIYQELSLKYQSRLNELASESNESAKNLMRIEIEQIERDWELFGNRLQVETALSIIERFDIGDATGLFEEWKEIVETSPPSFTDMIEAGLGETNWIAFGFSSTDLENVTVELVGDGKTAEIQGLSYLSFSAKLVPVGRNYLYHPFISSHGWKTTDGSTFLAPDVGGETGEVGWYVLGAIVIKNLELLTSANVEPADYDAVSAFPTGAKGSFQTNAINLSSPYIVGLLVERLKKFPN